MATTTRSRRPASAGQVWFVELALAVAIFTIVATIIEPDIFGGRGRLPEGALAGADRSPAEPPRVPSASPPPPQDTHRYDIVITGGRVMDPESGYDQAAQVGIDDGTITQISTGELQGRSEIDSRGMVVARGFIDIESYDPNPYGIWYKVGDGVTTNLGMHGTNGFADDWYTR